MKIKTTELDHRALDWAVSQAEKVEYRYMAVKVADYNGNWKWATRSYTNTLAGWAILEREKIGTVYDDVDWATPTDPDDNGERWLAGSVDGEHSSYGRTPLVAGLRCYVASELGDEVDVPDWVEYK